MWAAALVVAVVAVVAVALLVVALLLALPLGALTWLALAQSPQQTEVLEAPVVWWPLDGWPSLAQAPPR